MTDWDNYSQRIEGSDGLALGIVTVTLSIDAANFNINPKTLGGTVRHLTDQAARTLSPMLEYAQKKPVNNPFSRMHHVSGMVALNEVDQMTCDACGQRLKLSDMNTVCPVMAQEINVGEVFINKADNKRRAKIGDIKDDDLYYTFYHVNSKTCVSYKAHRRQFLLTFFKDRRE